MDQYNAAVVIASKGNKQSKYIGILYPTDMQVTSREKVTQRNITPRLIIQNASRIKSGKNGTIKQKSSEDHQQTRTDRSNSITSKASLATHQKRVLHLKNIKSIGKNQQSETREQIKIVPINNTFDANSINRDSKRNTSNPDKKEKVGRENNIYLGKRQNNEQQLTRKKSSGSGKIIFRPTSRSNSNRDDESLQKEDFHAKIMNVNLMANLNKNPQTHTFIQKIKQKKAEKDNKQRKNKQAAKTHLLELDIPIKGPEFFNLYQIYGELGKGAYGVVRMGVNKKTGEKVAIKYYPKKHLHEMNRQTNLEREINILAGLNHPIIAKLIEAIQTPADIYLVLEYGGANSLYNYLLSKSEHRLKQYEAKKFLLVISETIQYLHRKDIVHRDIKAENILINRFKELKLIDFGFSLHSVPPSTISTFCGTPTYMAPQIVSRLDHVPIYTDMWSLGILYYVMIQGNYPFRSKNEQDLFQKIRKGKFEYIHNDISDHSKRLIQSLLQVNPYQRLTIEDILSDKWRAFFQDARLEETNQ